MSEVALLVVDEHTAVVPATNHHWRRSAAALDLRACEKQSACNATVACCLAPRTSKGTPPAPDGELRRDGMTTAPTTDGTQRDPLLPGQTVVVIGGSSGIGLETARLARAEGADVILTGRNPDRLNKAASELGSQRTAAFDADDSGALEAFFAHLQGPIDHVMVTAGRPYYAPLTEMDFDAARRALQQHPMLMVGVARYGAGKVRPGRHAGVHGRHGGP
jgi:threonine dehydrogenase-like Zn-dependent dehydrogenase